MTAQSTEGFTNLPPAREKPPPFQSKLFQRREIDEIDEFDQVSIFDDIVGIQYIR